MKNIQEKIETRHYSSAGIATAVVKRADLSKQQQNRLLELIEKVYTSEQATPVRMELQKRIAPPPSLSELDQQLLYISCQLLGLCVKHKLSREKMYKRLQRALMAGMG